MCVCVKKDKGRREKRKKERERGCLSKGIMQLKSGSVLQRGQRYLYMFYART